MLSTRLYMDEEYLNGLKTNYNITENMHQKLLLHMYTMCMKSWPANMTPEVGLDIDFTARDKRDRDQHDEARRLGLPRHPQGRDQLEPNRR